MRPIVTAGLLAFLAGCSGPDRIVIVEARGESVTLRGAPEPASDRIASATNTRIRALDVDTLVRMYWVARGAECGVPIERVKILRNTAPLEFETPLADHGVISTSEAKKGDPLPDGQSLSGQIRLEVQVWPRREGVAKHPDLVVPEACVVAVVRPGEEDKLREAIRGLLDDLIQKEMDILTQEAKAAGYPAEVGK